jgi:tetratricopeptide (TPR) repeat protein
VAVASPQRGDPTRARTDEAEALYQESRDLVKAQQLEAAVLRLEKCIKLAPMYYACYKSLGSAHAKIASRDNSESERAKGRKFYERYLELAPPDDKDVPKVRGILEKAADRP